MLQALSICLITGSQPPAHRLDLVQWTVSSGLQSSPIVQKFETAAAMFFATLLLPNLQYFGEPQELDDIALYTRSPVHG